MAVTYCMPVIPSADLEKSLRFWVEGLGFAMDRAMRQKDKLVGCMVHNEQMYFWLNQRGDGPIPQTHEGIYLYWTPADIYTTREKFAALGFVVSDIEDRDYGQTEFFVTDHDGYNHCFGIATKATAAQM